MRVTANQLLPELLYASTTSSLIPWDWLDKSRGNSLLAMTEWERVERLLRAVNGDALAVREWIRLCGAPLIENAGPLGGASVPLLEEARISLRAALEGVMKAPPDAVPEIQKNAAEILDGKLIRVCEIVNGVPRDRVIAQSVGAALVFALQLVLDPEKPFRRRLRQCAWEECGRFALDKPRDTRGQPPNFFCPDTDHLVRYRRQQNNARKARERRRHK